MRIRALMLCLSIAGLPVLATVAVAGKKNKRPSDADRGLELYERHCVSCHGTTGHGDGPAAAAMVRPVPDLASVVTKDKVEDLVPSVLMGKGVMPGFEASFDRHDARRVLRHLARELVKPPVEDAPAAPPPDEAPTIPPDEEAPKAPPEEAAP